MGVPLVGTLRHVGEEAMMDQPGKQEEEPRGVPPIGTQPRLVLPAPPTTEMPTHSGKLATPIYSGKYPAQIRPEHLIRPKGPPAPKGPLAKLGYFWRQDPAYKAFIIAIAFVMIAAIFFISLASAAILGNSGSSNNSLSQNSSSGASPTGTVDLRPAFPTPGGANGSTASSQPPPQNTPTLHQTPNPTPDPSPSGQLTVQITNIPSPVPNNSRVNVSVSTSEGRVNVRLVVKYNLAPYYYESSTRMTGPQGNVNLNWAVNVFGFGKNATATVTAVAMDQNGHVASSAPMTVQVILRGG
jgi:hypothetical protein